MNANATYDLDLYTLSYDSFSVLATEYFGHCQRLIAPGVGGYRLIFVRFEPCEGFSIRELMNSFTRALDCYGKTVVE